MQPLACRTLLFIALNCVVSISFSDNLDFIKHPSASSSVFDISGDSLDTDSLKEDKQSIPVAITVPLEPFKKNKVTIDINSINKEIRTALIIGNSNYVNISQLLNPLNDAQDLAELLKSLQFKVILVKDANRSEMINAMQQFGQHLENGGVGVFYYAGHGVQVKGDNYLIPIDAHINKEHEIELESVNVNRVLGFMDSAKNRLNLVILDACRNNPFQRSFRSTSHGLAQMDAPSGTLIAYATSPGSVASDGVGRNGMYTKHLLQQLKVPNIEVAQMFKQVRVGVTRETSDFQTPWESTSLKGDFYFNIK